MLFTGNHDHVIDEKNRLSLPASMRNALDPERDGKGFYVVPGGEGHSLSLYTERKFLHMAEQFQSEPFADPDLHRFEQVFFGFAERVDMDASGRIGIPPGHLQMAGLGREVTVAGVRDHIEIWSRDEFARLKQEGWRNYTEVQRKAREAAQKERQSGRTPDHP